MLSGVAKPRLVCFNLSNNYSSLLASDLDGSTAPPAGSPNYEMEVDTAAGVLEEWQFHVDYATPANSTFTGPRLCQEWLHSLRHALPLEIPAIAFRSPEPRRTWIR